jgi:uncharacterized membrane protein
VNSIGTEQPQQTTAVAGGKASADHGSNSRLESVDLLRGLVIVLMALDHTRDFFHVGVFQGWDPLDLARTTPALFLTRWITHFCAPVFVFLAGTGASLSTTRGKSKRELSWFLLTRGLWLVLLEITWVRCLGWAFNFDFHAVWLLVIWAIGISMVVLSALVWLPRWAIAAFGLGMIFGHNALDPIQPDRWGAWAGLWRVLHAGGDFELWRGFRIGAGYPLVPWIGVMATGYSFGAVMTKPTEERRRWLISLGLCSVMLFFLFRFTNVYGDTRAWAPQKSPLFTLFSFLDCRKYPPSLCYLLMTLGPAVLFLRLFDGGMPQWLRPLLVFGRVPLFFYLLHLPIIHGFAVVVNLVRHGRADWLYGSTQGVKPPEDAGFGLVETYVAWILVLVILYPVCRWFAGLKRRRRDGWLSYL